MTADASDQQQPARASWALRVLAFLGVYAAIHFGRGLLMPIVLSVIFALTLAPIVRFSQKLKIPSVITSAILVFGVYAVVVSVAFTLATPLSEMVDNASQLGNRIKAKLGSLRAPIESINKAGKEVEKITSGEGSEGKENVAVEQPGLAVHTADLAVEVVASGILVLVLTFFLLISRELIYTKFIQEMSTLSEKNRLC